jgi:hypothetical protein
MNSTESMINELPATVKVGLGDDTIEILLSYTNIGQIDSAIELLAPHMDNDAKEKLKLARQDVRPVFDDLTDNPEELCNVMRKSKVILSGSRAVNLFKPGSSSKASDYDFYAEDNVHSIAMFMAYMTSIGVNWLISNNTDEDVTTLQDEHYYYQLARFQLIRGTLNRNGRVLEV